jgi:DNA-binding SARP family transcriptional activator/class 3 adenylate cyclase
VENGVDTAAAGLPAGTVALLFSDVEGSTGLLRALGDDYQAVLADHDRLLRAACARHGGHVVDTQGDSFFVAFSRAGDAVAAAAKAQRAVVDHDWPDGVTVRVRMGIHAGEPVVAGERYVGLGVHRAARIASAANGGQVLLSQAAAALVGDRLDDDVRLRDLGPHALKDFDAPERLFQLEIAGLESSFPPLRTGDGEPVPVTRLDFRLLGPLEVVDGEARLPLTGRNQRAVLALLLLHAGHPLSTERIVDELWGEAPPKTATASVQNTISQLRRLLGAERLVTRPAGYVLVVGDGESDLARFEGLVARSRAVEPEERTTLLAEALGLWRGDPLADLEHETFAQEEIRRMEELRQAAVEERLDAEIACGRHREAIAELESVISRNPLRERPRAMHMLALYRAGRQAEALQAYQDARRVLVEELGIEPGPELQELHAAVLRQDRALRPAGTESSVADHLELVANAMLAGRVVAVLGPGAALGDGGGWRSGAARPPTAEELAHHLADRFGVVDGGHLARVSEIAAATQGLGALHDELDAVLRADFEPGVVHRFLAELPGLLRAGGRPQPLIVTTELDGTLERAFANAGEPVDVVTYLAAGPHRGRFAHVTPDGAVTVIDEPNAYARLSLDARAVVLRAHGRVDPSPSRSHESFVVSEDDHIDYLLDAEPGAAVPVTLAAKLRRSHVLFLGYGVADWSLRVFLRRIWGADRLGYRSWAVDASPDRLTRELWRARDVDVYELTPAEYVAELRERVVALAPLAVRA